MANTYQINEVFYSLQGEGVRAGTPNIFVRFSGCNLACDLKEGPRSPGGFACDTEFASGKKLTLEEIAEWVVTAYRQANPNRQWSDWKEPWFILTGGEPGLQVDKEFIDWWRSREVKFAIETNGTINLDHLGLDWISLSPKVAEHAVKQLRANELRYVRGWGQGIPKPAASADHYCISPAFDGGIVHLETLKWCMKLCLENPMWRLSVQQHKGWGVR